jgi:hypothetical protein
MTHAPTAPVIDDVRALLRAHYLDPGVAAELDAVLANAMTAGRYEVGDERALAELVTVDLQSVNSDKHLRLNFHDEPLADRSSDDAREYAEMTRWAASTAQGISAVQHLEGNVGLIGIAPVLFPAAISAWAISSAMGLVADCDALMLDLRGCLGGDPDQVAWLASYLFGPETVQLSSLDEPRRGLIKQSWTLAHVPGPRFGREKPVYVLTGRTTFSGGEQLSYDLQSLARATVVGEQTRGGAHAREGFRVTAHLEATISVARAVNPVTHSNWEGVGVTPDISTPAADALTAALNLHRAQTQVGQSSRS